MFPSTLTATITGSACSTLDPQVTALTYNPGTGRWTGDFQCDDASVIHCDFWCDPDDSDKLCGRLYNDDGEDSCDYTVKLSIAGTEVDCDPLDWLAEMVITDCCGCYMGAVLGLSITE